MLAVDPGEIEIWVATFLWPFCRFAAFLGAMPLFGHPNVPMNAKALLAAVLTLLVAPALPATPDVPVVSAAGLGLIVEQVLVGTAMGFSVRLALAAVQLAGDAIGVQMGLGFAMQFSVDAGNSIVLSRLLYTIALLMLLAFDVHLALLEVLAESFVALPIGAGLAPAGWWALLQAAGALFSVGLAVSLPVVAALLIVNIALGVMNRSAPQITIFSVGFPITLGVGLLLLTAFMTQLATVFERLFFDAVMTLRAVVTAFAA